MPLCTCGHEQHEHEAGMGWDAVCTRCSCTSYTERPVLTQSNWDLPIGQGARDLYWKCHDADLAEEGTLAALDILAAADERHVRTLLWARRTGRL